MKQSDIRSILESIELEDLQGDQRSNIITKLFMLGVSYKAIAEMTELSSSRISQIMSKQAEKAQVLINLRSDDEYKGYLHEFLEVLNRGDVILMDHIRKNEKSSAAYIEAMLQYTQKFTDYIISLVHLYGMVHKDKVMEIYNKYNRDKISNISMNGVILAGNKHISESILKNNFVETHGDYFLHETVLEFDRFGKYINSQETKPFYIPPEKELLKYKDDMYYENTKEFRTLKSYIQRQFMANDSGKAEELTEEIQGICQFDLSMQTVFDCIDNFGVELESENQINELVLLISDLANNTRIWENNGHTPNEIRRMTGRETKVNKVGFPFAQKEQSQPRKMVKVGRNDPCPCGSGKKYKKCCLSGSELH